MDGDAAVLELLHDARQELVGHRPVHEQGLGRVAHARPLGLGVDHDVEGHVEVGRGVDVDLAVAHSRLDRGHRRLLDEAIAHIRRWGSGHTEAIITDSVTASQQFVAGVDAAAVMVNASTRFTDGGEFGFGAEIGISTQKLHARGPMGLTEMTTTTYVVTGTGQTR